jgi:hypothetical protein
MVDRVARRGANPGDHFWGCPDYPDCTGTRPLGRQAIVAAPALAVVGIEGNVAGRSATATYERRLARHRLKVRSRRWEILAFGGSVLVASIVLTFGGGRIGPTWPFFGVALGFAAVGWIVYELFGQPLDILSWKRGAIGEQATATLLAGLPDRFVVLHDRQIPGSQANIDHVVVGPTGVFVVETKRYRGSLTIRDNELFIESRRKTTIVEQAIREAEAVRRVLIDAGESALSITPILCMHLTELPWRTPTIAGVAIVGPRGLTKSILGGTGPLTSEDVIRVARILEGGLRPA